MSKRGLPSELKMRHDAHYVEELSQSRRTFGRTIAINSIEPNPEQPRTEMGDLTELILSIREKGILEPLLVKPLKNLNRWLIIAGERRWRAGQLAGLTEVPCIELDIDEQEVAEIALIENLQRKDLTVWEEADAIAALSKRFGHTHEELAQKLGKSRSSVTESLSVSGLPFSVREKCVSAGINTKSGILQVARQFDDAAMLETVERLKKRNSSDGDKEKPRNSLVTEEGNGLSGSPNGINFPIRVFTYVSPEKDFKFEAKFKNPAGKTQFIKSLEQLINKLKETD